MKRGTPHRALRDALLRWYRRDARDLPWRTTQDPYHIWLSEILLQQTRVATARPYYERFVQALPTVQALAAAPLDRVLKLWEGLGYYARARNLHCAAQLIVADLGGQLPRTADAWQRLPGVGPYTAGAIASIAFGARVPAVDGNVKRVLARLFRLQTPLDDRATRAALWRLAEELLCEKSPGTVNQALMELGACLCTPRTPRCTECPVAPWCAARAAGVERKLPIRRPRKTVPHVEAIAAIIRARGRHLLTRRPAGLLAGLWGWPGTELAEGEQHDSTLRKALRDAFGLEIVVGDRLATVRHEFSHRRLRLHVYACRLVRRTPRHARSAGANWLSPAELERYPLARVDRKVWAAVMPAPAERLPPPVPLRRAR